MVTVTLSGKQRGADMSAEYTSPIKSCDSSSSASFVGSHIEKVQHVNGSKAKTSRGGLALKQFQKGLFGSSREKREEVSVRTPPATPDAEPLALPTLRVSIVAEPKGWSSPAPPHLDGGVFDDSVRSVGQLSSVFSDLTNTDTATANVRKQEPSASDATAYLRNVLSVCGSKGMPRTPEGNTAAGTHLPKWGMAPTANFSDSDSDDGHRDDASGYRSESSVYYDNIECVLATESVAGETENKEALKIEKKDKTSKSEPLTWLVLKHERDDPEPAFERERDDPEPAFERERHDPEPALKQQRDDPGLALKQERDDPEPALKQAVDPSSQGNAITDINVLTTVFEEEEEEEEEVILCQPCAFETIKTPVHDVQTSVYIAAKTSEKEVPENAGVKGSGETDHENLTSDPDDFNKTHRQFPKPRRVFSLLKLHQLFKTRPFGSKKQQPDRKPHQKQQRGETVEKSCSGGITTENARCDDDDSLFTAIENVCDKSPDGLQDNITFNDAPPLLSTSDSKIVIEPAVESEISALATTGIDLNVENAVCRDKHDKLNKPKFLFALKLPKIYKRLVLTRHFNKASCSKQETEQPQHLSDARSTANHPRQKSTKKGRWKAVTDDKSGKVYFYHTVTKETSWKRPLDFLEWRAKRDTASGGVYFYNVLSNETSWEKPADFVEWKVVSDKASGETYYYNVLTKETTWDTPEGFEVTDTRVKRQQHMQDEERRGEQERELASQQVRQEPEGEEVEEIWEYEFFEATSTPSDELNNTMQEIVTISNAVEPAAPVAKVANGLTGILLKHNPAPVLRTDLTKTAPKLDESELLEQFTPETEKLAMLLAEHSPKNRDDNVQLLRQLKGSEKVVLNQLESLLGDTPFDELEQVVSSFVKSKIESATNDGEIPIITTSAESAKSNSSSTTMEAPAPPPINFTSVQSAQSYSMNSRVMTPASEVSIGSRYSTHQLMSRVLSHATGIVSHNTGAMSEMTDRVNNTTTDIFIKPSHGMVVITETKEEKAADLIEDSFIATGLEEGSCANADDEPTAKAEEVSVKRKEEKNAPSQQDLPGERDRALQAEDLAGRAEEFSCRNKSKSKESSTESIAESAGETANADETGDWEDDVSELSVSVGPTSKKQKQKEMMLRKKEEAQKIKKNQVGESQSAGSQKAGCQIGTSAIGNGAGPDISVHAYDRYQPNLTQNDGNQKEWTQTELDRFISQNDWDNVAKYIAKMRRESPTEPEPEPLPHLQMKDNKVSSFAPSATSPAYAVLPSQSAPRKRFGARSQLQHDEIDDSSEDDESSWDDNTVTTRSEYTDDESKSHEGSAYSSVVSSRRGDESSREESTGKSQRILESSRRNSRYDSSFQV